MYEFIEGEFVEKSPAHLIVKAAHLAYYINISVYTYSQLSQLSSGRVYLHFVVREDAQLLYGFIDERDRALFRQLIKVSGVGPKLGLTILSGMDSASFARCVQRDDISALVALPGVGKKTAERLLVEMRDKLKDWLGHVEAELPVGGGVAIEPVSDRVADAESALIALGYKPAEAAKVVAAVNDDSVSDSEELIRRALKSMVSG